MCFQGDNPKYCSQMPILIKTREEEYFCWDKGYFMSAELGSTVNRLLTP